ncbi:hypothetical protein B0H14DRAFT_3169646 [Mycena olivaceomarginata]|nr:hypothetical protein B0H14DRAFT_3169646 [Mycena olivaceomarginata]
MLRWLRVGSFLLIMPKKIEWAGWAYGQVEALVNRVRPQNKKREIDLTILQNETLKAASATKSSQLANAKIRQATQEEIDEFDLILADNLRVWGANEVEVATEVFNSLWLPVDEDPDVERWREETFMGGTDLGVEEEKDLSSETLCEMLGWNHETGIPAAFSPYIPCDPTLPSGASGGKEQTTVHWHQKVGVLAMLRKASQPPKNPRDRLPANASPIDKAIACRALKQGWANSPGVLLADDVGTGKTLQMLALVATLIQLFDYQRLLELQRKIWRQADVSLTSFLPPEAFLPSDVFKEILDTYANLNSVAALAPLLKSNKYLDSYHGLLHDVLVKLKPEFAKITAERKAELAAAKALKKKVVVESDDEEESEHDDDEPMDTSRGAVPVVAAASVAASDYNQTAGWAMRNQADERSEGSFSIPQRGKPNLRVHSAQGRSQGSFSIPQRGKLNLRVHSALRRSQVWI